MKKKQEAGSPYTGFLGQPIPVWPLLLDPEKPEFFYRTVLVQECGESPKAVADFWRQWVGESRAAYTLERQRRYQLLFDHYGIQPNDPQAKDKLLEALMAPHVPGFNTDLALQEQQQRRAFKPTKLDVPGTAALYHRSILKQKKNLTKEEKHSIEKITRKLLKLGLAQRTIDNYSAQFRTAASKYIAGKHSDFQRQFIEVVLPWLESAFNDWRVSQRGAAPTETERKL